MMHWSKMASALAICLLLSISLQSFAWLSLSPVKMWHKIPHVMCAPDYDFPMNQVQRSEVPTRYDSCKMLITGVVGTDPREVYMKNRHYVINFALAVVGHFKAIHEMEAYKPTETMWLSTEVWDGVAKAAYPNIKKGSVVRGVGHLIHNKWVDKNSGEERKMFKVRMTKLLNSDEFNDISLAFEGTEDRRGSSLGMASSDSGFSAESPEMHDQAVGYDMDDSAASVPTNSVGTGYSYRKPAFNSGNKQPSSTPRNEWRGQGSATVRKESTTYPGQHVQEEDDTEEVSAPWWG